MTTLSMLLAQLLIHIHPLHQWDDTLFLYILCDLQHCSDLPAKVFTLQSVSLTDLGLDWPSSLPASVVLW